MEDVSDKVSFDVPELGDLYDYKIIQKIECIYLTYKNKFTKKFPILDEYPQDMIPIYLAYFIIYLKVINENEETSLKYVESLKNDVFLAKEVGSGIPIFAQYLSNIHIEEKDYTEEYEKYKNDSRELICKKDPKVVSFMDKVYNDNVKRTIYGYIIGFKCPSFEKIDLNLDTEQTIDLCVYTFYRYLYHYYLNICGNNPFYRFKFRRVFKNTNSETLNELTSSYLSNVDEDLYTFEEFIDCIQKRQMAILEIIVFSHTQLEEYESLSRVRTNE